jgi:hypothetical protein
MIHRYREAFAKKDKSLSVWFELYTIAASKPMGGAGLPRMRAARRRVPDSSRAGLLGAQPPLP